MTNTTAVATPAPRKSPTKPAPAAAKKAPKAIAKSVAKPATKSAKKPMVKTAVGSARKVGAKTATRPAPKAAPKAAQKTKQKPVRDSFSMPKADFDLIDVLKQRAIGFKQPVKKSELLRAGLHALSELDDARLAAVIGRLTSIKAGRPKKNG